MRRVASTLLLALLLACPAWAQEMPNGRFRVAYGKATTEISRSVEASLKSSGADKELEQAINSSFQFPYDLTMVFAETGTPKCYYREKDHQIVISYDFIAFAGEKIFGAIPDRAEATSVLGGVITYTLLQELGHAMIREWDLPTTGEDEDAAAELTALILMTFPDGKDAALATAYWYQMLAKEQTDLEDLPFWSETPLDHQRYYDLLAYLWASDPKAYLFVEKQIPNDRLLRAQRELPRKMRNWDILLAPFVVQ